MDSNRERDMGNTVPLHPPVSEARIELIYKDRTGYVIKVFDNVQQLASFLKENGPVANAVGYVKKTPPPPPEKKPDLVKETMKQFLKIKTLNGIYGDPGLMMCVEAQLIEKNKHHQCWELTPSGKMYIEKLRLEK